jgi:hypothetical protein
MTSSIKVDIKFESNPQTRKDEKSWFRISRKPHYSMRKKCASENLAIGCDAIVN